PRRAGTVFSSRNLMAWQFAALPRITKQTNEVRRGGEKLSIGRVRLHDQNQGRETGARKPLRDLPIYRRRGFSGDGVATLPPGMGSWKSFAAKAPPTGTEERLRGRGIPVQTV